MPALDLLVVADSVEGGLGASAVAHAEWFASHGWMVGLVAPDQAEGETCGVHRLSVGAVASALDVADVRAAARSLRRLLSSSRPSVVHAHGTRAQLLCLLAGRRPFVTMHGGGGRVPGQSSVGTWSRQLGRSLAPLLAQQSYSAAPAGRGWDTVLHASPRLGRLDHVASSPSAQTPEFLWLGRLDEPKQPLTFVRACALAAQSSDVTGVVVGDGPQRSMLEAEAARLGAPVKFAGETADVAGYLERAWAVCLFSGFEGVPFSMQEAMWAGRPVVLSPLPSLRWFAGSAATYAGSADEVAEVLLSLTSPEVVSQLGARAKERIHKLLTPQDPFPRYLTDYGPR